MQDQQFVSIIEDDLAVRIAIESLVRSFGYATFAFASAEKFLESTLIDKSDCLITDVRLGGMSGVELQARLRARGSKVPIIFITAFLEDRVLARAKEAGAAGFLTKPFVAQDLLQSIEHALFPPRN